MEHMLRGDANSLENTDKSSTAITFYSSCDSKRTSNEFRILPRWRDDDNGGGTRDQIRCCAACKVEDAGAVKK